MQIVTPNEIADGFSALQPGAFMTYFVADAANPNLIGCRTSLVDACDKSPADPPSTVRQARAYAWSLYEQGAARLFQRREQDGRTTYLLQKKREPSAI